MTIEPKRFERNLAEARQCGYDFVCVECGCGCGFEDDSDEHDMFCPRHPEYGELMETAKRWAAKKAAESEVTPAPETAS